MLTKQLAATAKVTTYCTCTDYDEDTDTVTESETCYGYCYQEAENDAAEVVGDWLDGHKLDNGNYVVRIDAGNLGWRHLTGYKIVQLDAVKIVQALYLNGDFTVTLELSDENKLTAGRSSHDELGAYFEFSVVEVCAASECEETESLRENKYGERVCDWHAELEEN